MASTFGTVVWVVCGVGIVGAIASLLLTGRTWRQYGRHHLLMEHEPASPGASATAAERDEEVRQMLEARNARRRRRGEPELDLERELTRLTGPAIDSELRSEIRELVIARNHRRARQGKPALDVAAEIERQIADLGEL